TTPASTAKPAKHATAIKGRRKERSHTFISLCLYFSFFSLLSCSLFPFSTRKHTMPDAKNNLFVSKAAVPFIYHGNIIFFTAGLFFVIGESER
ncbi:MAG: hypothetical protein LBV07_02705, partial [Syntrophobacterales bacterium]|nr:hypothetical protein [Syntrophobacterales bacterium]